MKNHTIESAQILGPQDYVPFVMIKFEGIEKPETYCDPIFDDWIKLYGSDTRKWRGKKLAVYESLRLFKPTAQISDQQ
jgi:hypothetical protein